MECLLRRNLRCVWVRGTSKGFRARIRPLGKKTRCVFHSPKVVYFLKFPPRCLEFQYRGVCRSWYSPLSTQGERQGVTTKPGGTRHPTKKSPSSTPCRPLPSFVLLSTLYLCLLRSHQESWGDGPTRYEPTVSSTKRPDGPRPDFPFKRKVKGE